MGSHRIISPILGLFVLVSLVQAETIRTQWGGLPNSNMTVPAENLPTDLESATLLWEAQLGPHQYTLPTIHDGVIYVGTGDARYERLGARKTGGGVLMALDAMTGKTIWEFLTPRKMEGIKPPYHYNQWKCGVCSGPIVDGNRIYIVGGRGEVLCLDRHGQANGNDGPFVDELDYMEIADGPGRALAPTDGDLIWVYDMVAGVDVVPHDVCGSTPLLLNDWIIVCTSNGQDDIHDIVPKPQAPTLIVLDKRTGRLVATDDARIGERMFHGHWSSPVYARIEQDGVSRDRIFFGGGDGYLYAFDLPTPTQDGTVAPMKARWSVDCNPPHYRVDSEGKPREYSNHRTRILTGPSEVIGSPVFYEGRIYVAIGQSPLHGEGQGCLSCFDAATGDVLWRSTDVARSTSTVSAGDGLVFLADWSGGLHCFDAITGKRYWKHDMEAGTWAASTMIADGKVYVGTDRNVLWVLKASKDKEILGRNRLRSVPTTVTALGDILFVPVQNRLFAYRASENKSQ